MNISQTYQYQVFGNAQFTGNPASVVQLASFPDDDELLAHAQSLATEDNAYFVATDFPQRFKVRAFSHTAPLQICGHALLATAHHLFETTENTDALMLGTPVFSHSCTRKEDELWLALPRYTFEPLQPLPPALLALFVAAGLQEKSIEQVLVFPFRVFVVITHSLTALQNFNFGQFDWRGMAVLEPGALIVSCALGDGGYAYRYFAPWFGKPEDSATGSAHCYLAPFWLESGQGGDARQMSPQGVACIKVALTPAAVWISGAVEPDRIAAAS